MATVSNYLKRHHVGLLALILVLGGGTAYAASAIPKNAVASKQIKNNSVQGKDLKDGSLTTTDLANGTVANADLAPGSVTGGVIADGSVGKTDLATGVVPQVVTATKVAAADATWRPYVSVAGLATIEFRCADATSGGLRFIAPGNGIEVYSYIEVEALDHQELDTNQATNTTAYVIERSVTGHVVAGRVVAHSATQSLDVDVRVNHEDGCSISGTSTLTQDTSGVPG